MSRSIEGKIKINSFADIVGAKKDAVAEIPLADLHEFRNHPFRVLDDEKMDETVASIKEHGILVPGIVRPLIDGGYEIISGHRRKRACEILGLETMPAIIKKYTDDEAVIAMVDSNIYREDILPSEKAFAYKMKYDVMKHRGSKKGERTLESIGESAGDSAKTVQRYVYLASLNNKLLSLVDEKKIMIIPAVDLSFMRDKEQEWVAGIVEENKVSISKEMAANLKILSQKRELSKELIERILLVKKPKPRKITIGNERLSEFFEDETTSEEIEEIIFRLLSDWKNGR